MDDARIIPPTPEMILQRLPASSYDAVAAWLVTDRNLRGRDGEVPDHARRMVECYLMGATGMKGSGGQENG